MKLEILTIDRNKNFLGFIANTLRSVTPEANTHSTDSIDKGLEILDFNDINILICEEQLDDMIRLSHFSSLQMKKPSLMIIATSSYHNPEFRADSICNGALEALTKPVSKNSLSTILSYTIEMLEIYNKKSLLLKDILMLLREGQVFPPATLHTLIVSLENRYDLTRNKSNHAIKVLDNFVKIFNLSPADKMILELAILFKGVPTSLLDVENIKIQQKDTKGGKSIVTPDNITKALLISVNSHGWYDNNNDQEMNNLSDNLIFLSGLLSVINAYSNLSSTTVLGNTVEEDTIVTTLHKFSSTRFDPAIVTTFLSSINESEKVLKAN